MQFADQRQLVTILSLHPTSIHLTSSPKKRKVLSNLDSARTFLDNATDDQLHNVITELKSDTLLKILKFTLLRKSTFSPTQLVTLNNTILHLSENEAE